jgi:hypothetical protein
MAAATGSAILTLAPAAEAKTLTVKGVVQDGSKQPVAAAVVYLVPAGDVAKLAKPPSIEIRKDVSNDEPMEDNLAANRDKYLKGTTDKNGAFTISGVADGKYFVYAEPSSRDHLPGGDLPTSPWRQTTWPRSRSRSRYPVRCRTTPRMSEALGASSAMAPSAT